MASAGAGAGAGAGVEGASGAEDAEDGADAAVASAGITVAAVQAELDIASEDTADAADAANADDGTSAAPGEGGSAAPGAAAAPARRPWPASLPEQMRAVADTLSASPAALGEAALAERFSGRGPWKKRLPQILQTLQALGRARAEAAAAGTAWRAA